MLARLLLLLPVVALLASYAAGQTTCASPGLQTCITLEMTTPSSDYISLTFKYDSAGDICSITTGSIVQSGSTGYSATINSGTPTSVGGSPARVTVTNGMATSIVIGFTATLDNDPNSAVNFAGNLGSGSANVLVASNTNGGQTNAASLVFNGFASETQFGFSPNGPNINEQINLAGVTNGNDHCGTSTSTHGDPHFTGFHGQQFEVFGFPNAVLNILSDSDMQLNARLVELAEGDCMTYSQMKLVRLTTGDAIPMTKWFDHAGSYMEELGLAIVGGHRLYAKAGAYKNGFESVTFDGEDFPVSATRTFGAGQDAIVIKRVNTHQISVRTPFIRLALVNSDKFFNVEPVSFVKAYDANVHPFAGALGQTADANFTVQVGDAEWQSKIEQSALVVSNDLFEFSAAQ